MRRFLFVVATVALLPMISFGAASANGSGPTLSIPSASYTDTTAWDTFSDVNGTITGVTAGTTDTALVNGVAADNPPDTAALTYTKMVVGDYGTMFIGSGSSAVRYAYVVDSDAVNALASGSDTDDFVFDKDGDWTTTGDQTTFTVTVTGANDAPAIGTALEDFTEGVTEDDVSYTVGSHPSAESPIKAFDDSSSTKYLNFAADGSDLIVDVGAPHVLTGLGLTTANDSPERDPTKVRIYGSNSLAEAFTEIGSEITLSPPSARLTDYPDSPISNSTPYSVYRLVFTEISNAVSANSMQIAEVRLAGFTAAGFPEYTPGDPATGFASAVTIYDENTTSASAEITENLTSGDVLACPACAENSITATWASPVLSLAPSGSPTQANWQAAMRSLTFLRLDAVGTTGPTIELSVSDGGSTPGTAEIDILISLVAPSIEPAAASVVIVAGTAITPITPTNAGDDATWTISPALPSGLSLDSATGVISGTAAAASAAVEYTLTATNSVGSDTATFSLTVADLPAAPTALSATAGDGTASITFTAGANGGSAITNYQYTLDDGTTWTALDPADTESPITISGLTNGTAYTISIRAISAAGNGAASAGVTATPTAPTTTTTTTLVPNRDSSGQLPQITDGTKGIVVTDGVRTEFAVAVVDDKELVLAGDGFEMRLSGTSVDGGSLPIGTDGRLNVDSGGSVSVSGNGFAPGSTVHVWVMSDPQYLGPVTVGADGAFSGVFALPDGLPVGNHTVQANGVTNSGQDRSLNLGIALVPSGELPATGAGTGTLVALLTVTAGALALLSTRRRQTIA